MLKWICTGPDGFYEILDAINLNAIRRLDVLVSGEFKIVSVFLISSRKLDRYSQGNLISSNPILPMLFTMSFETNNSKSYFH